MLGGKLSQLILAGVIYAAAPIHASAVQDANAMGSTPPVRQEGPCKGYQEDKIKKLTIDDLDSPLINYSKGSEVDPLIYALADIFSKQTKSDVCYFISGDTVRKKFSHALIKEGIVIEDDKIKYRTPLPLEGMIDVEGRIEAKKAIIEGNYLDEIDRYLLGIIHIITIPKKFKMTMELKKENERCYFVKFNQHTEEAGIGEVILGDKVKERYKFGLEGTIICKGDRSPNRRVLFNVADILNEKNLITAEEEIPHIIK